ncbi:J domain-containing protein [candidate division FCPU426 bacterium]|nr:J domain-containing protein [candidate division FCPU426 bacterium]
MVYADLKAALEVFALCNRATMRDIQKRHRELVKKHHPDACGEESEKIRHINAAYKILKQYIETYRYAFSEEEFYGQYPEERVRRQFSDDPLWGQGWKPRKK